MVLSGFSVVLEAEPYTTEAFSVLGGQMICRFEEWLQSQPPPPPETPAYIRNMLSLRRAVVTIDSTWAFQLSLIKDHSEKAEIRIVSKALALVFGWGDLVNGWNALVSENGEHALKSVKTHTPDGAPGGQLTERGVILWMCEVH